MEAGYVVVVADKLQFWPRFVALCTRLGTPGVKATAGWWIGWTGYLARKDNATDPSFRVRDRCCRYQGLGIGMTGRVKYLLRHSHLHHLAHIHDGEIVADTL